MTHDHTNPHLACRAYEAHLPDGTVANVAFTLGRPDADNVAARFARRNGARAYGLVSLAGPPACWPAYPMVWEQFPDRIAITATEEDGVPDERVRSLVARLLPVFFNDIGPLAPDLAVATPVLEPHEANRTLH